MTEAETAKILGLQKGKFYCYFKPSFCNYNPLEMRKLNAHFRDEEGHYSYYVNQMYPTVQQQLLHGLYCDEFAPDNAYLSSLASTLQSNGDFLTKPLLDHEFDRCFPHDKRSNNVRFEFDPDFKKFKNAVENGKSDKPMLLFLVSDLFLANYFGIKLPSLIQQDYADMFECYFAVAG